MLVMSTGITSQMFSRRHLWRHDYEELYEEMTGWSRNTLLRPGNRTQRTPS